MEGIHKNQILTTVTVLSVTPKCDNLRYRISEMCCTCNDSLILHVIYFRKEQRRSQGVGSMHKTYRHVLTYK